MFKLIFAITAPAYAFNITYLAKKGPFMNFFQITQLIPYFLPIESLVVLLTGQIVGLGAS